MSYFKVSKDGASPAQLDEHDRLACPRCGDGYLHQDAVEVFWRTEDAIKGARVTTSAEGTAFEAHATQDANPSTRRDGLRIVFWCETCADGVGPLKLVVVQHKGCTYLEWES